MGYRVNMYGEQERKQEEKTRKVKISTHYHQTNLRF